MSKSKKFSIQIPEYNPVVTSAFQQLSSREYDGSKWTFPINLLNTVCEIIDGFYPEIKAKLASMYPDLYENRKLREDMQGAVTSYDKTIQDILTRVRIPDGLSLYPFQEVGVAFIELTKGRALVGDEMGLGKTVQVLVWLSMQDNSERVIWVTKSKLKAQTKEEIAKWLPQKTVQSLDTGKQESVDADITIISYDLVGKQLDNLMNLNPSIVIMDEITMITNYKTQRAVSITELVQKSKKIIGISGTPLRGKPKHFWTFLNMMDASMFPSFHMYGLRYCDARQDSFGWNYEGTSNYDTLHTLIKPNMLRRQKEDVAEFLPTKRRMKLIVDMPEELEKSYQSFEAHLNTASNNRYNKNVRYSKLSAMRKIVGMSKASQIADIISPYVEAGEKTVLYIHHKEVRNYLMKELKRYNPLTIHGESSNKRAAEDQRLFQENPNFPLIILSTLAGGSGLNLDAASFGFFVERQWVADDEDQAENRIHRLTSEKPVLIYYLHIPNTIDDWMEAVTDRKRATSGLIMDGEYNREVNQKKVIDDILDYADTEQLTIK